MHKIRILFVLFTLLFSTRGISQSLQLYSENFESATPTFSLNNGLVGASMGTNQWVINNSFNGLGIYQNTYPQDSTFSGTITNAPFSKYLHITNTSSAATNANYDPNTQSSNFTSMQPNNNVCTFGYNNVTLSFFYLCEGHSGAYAQIYYSKDFGPWLQVGDPQYNNTYKWKYVTVTDTGFNNAGDLRIGFLWVNSSSPDPNPVSMAIDDIRLVGFYDVNNPTVTINTTPLADTVCQGTSILAMVQLSGFLCDGNYLMELSTATGTFPNPLYPALIYTVNYPQTTFFINVPLPPNIVPGDCYKIRVSRFAPPPPDITGEISVCFVIKYCPATVTTIQPSITRDTNAVCVNSVIDVPFYSTGVFTNNLYSAQLSDSNGVFPTTPPFTILGSLPDDAAHPFPPGSVSGKIPNSPNVPPGCNYFVRVNSSNPQVYGVPWGPFCIQRCDINFNNQQDVSLCLQPTTAPWDTLLDVDVNYWDTIPDYLPGNKFTLEIRNSNPLPPPTPWGFVNIDSLGFTFAIDDTTIYMRVPPLDTLISYGIKPGSYYMRVVATNAEFPDSSHSNVVRLTIGAPKDATPTFNAYHASLGVWNPDTICRNGVLNFFLQPPHPDTGATYYWSINGQVFESKGPTQGNGGINIIFNGTGNFVIAVYEIQFGCKGATSDTMRIFVKGPPNTAISCPPSACVGEIIHATAPYAGTAGTWTYPGGTLDNLGDDEIYLHYTVANINPGYTIGFEATNECGFAPAIPLKIKVYDPPSPKIFPSDTVICIGQTIDMWANSQKPLSQFSFLWTNGPDTLKSSGSWIDSTFQTDPKFSGYYTLTVGVGNQSVCPRSDSVFIEVRGISSQDINGVICDDGTDTLTLSSILGFGSHVWNTGETTNDIVVTQTGTYHLSVTTDTSVCKQAFVYRVEPGPCPIPPEDTVNLVMPNIFIPNGNGLNDYFTPLISGPYDLFEVTIYNRWGKIVYGPVSDPFFKWYGIDNNGKDVAAGVYYWIANASYKGENYPGQRGFVTLVRGEH